MKLLAKVKLPNVAEWYSAQNFWVDTNLASLAQSGISWARKLKMGDSKKWNVTRHNKESLWLRTLGQILTVE